MMVISQIHFGQYYILDIQIWVRSEKENCLQKKKLNHRNHGQVTHSAKKSADSLAQIPEILQSLFGRHAQLA